MEKGNSATLLFTVQDCDTAAATGVGDLAVLGTSKLLAWCEAATCAAIDPSISASQATVCTRVSLERLDSSPVGEAVSVTATVAYADGRLVRFEVVASHLVDEKVIGHGEMTRSWSTESGSTLGCLHRTPSKTLVSPNGG